MAQPSTLRRGGRHAAGPGGSESVRAVELRLVGGFEVRDRGEPVELPLTAQRLLAFLALQERPMQRAWVASRLWLDTSEERAFASLRSAIWRVKQSQLPLLRTPDTRLALDPDVQIDLAAALRLARLLRSDEPDVDVRLDDLGPLRGEVLPDWYDDWLVMERETHRQLRLHALEALANRLSGAARYGEAIEAALAAVAAEPLRESAHRTLCRVYLAEGNATEALRHAQLYRELLLTQLGLSPSPEFEAIVTPG